MSSSIAVFLLIIISLIAANLPFLSDRVLFVFKADSNKSFWLRFFALPGVIYHYDLKKHLK